MIEMKSYNIGCKAAFKSKPFPKRIERTCNRCGRKVNLFRFNIICEHCHQIADGYGRRVLRIGAA